MNRALQTACLWFADGLYLKHRFPNDGEAAHQWVNAFAEGRWTTAKYIIQSAIADAPRWLQLEVGRLIASHIKQAFGNRPRTRSQAEAMV